MTLRFETSGTITGTAQEVLAAIERQPAPELPAELEVLVLPKSRHVRSFVHGALLLELTQEEWLSVCAAVDAAV